MNKLIQRIQAKLASMDDNNYIHEIQIDSSSWCLAKLHRKGMEMTDFDAASESSIEEWLQNDCDHVFKEEIATLRSNECVKCGMKNPDSEPDF